MSHQKAELVMDKRQDQIVLLRNGIMPRGAKEKQIRVHSARLT